MNHANFLSTLMNASNTKHFIAQSYYIVRESGEVNSPWLIRDESKNVEVGRVNGALSLDDAKANAYIAIQHI